MKLLILLIYFLSFKAWNFCVSEGFKQSLSWNELSIMRRRNAECGKLRRPIKRTKISDGVYGSLLLYFKFVLLWLLVITADYILEFRFEFLWPFWLLLRSVYDSFKYQGLAFSVFFVCIALTSDMICFFFIPVQWLFFAASTYVWVQYVWHTEKGICLPTVVLWLLFVYIEAAVRLKDLKHLPFHSDLCRPFAAHCIGYPVVTLGFGFKSYVGYRMRQKKQRDVAKANEFYMQLLQQALPAEQQSTLASSAPSDKLKVEAVTKEISTGNGIMNNSHHNSQTHSCSTKSSSKKSVDKVDVETKNSSKNYTHTNGSSHHHTQLDFIERVTNVNDFDPHDVEKDCGKSLKNISIQNLKSNKDQSSGSNKWTSNQNHVNSQREKRGKINRDDHANNSKDEFCSRLEADIKRLKSDLQQSRQTEQDLRSQISNLIAGDKNARVELSQLKQDNDELQSKVHGLVSARQSDRQNIANLERKLNEEKKLRLQCESQLVAEKKAKRAEEAAAARAIASNAAQNNKSECTESCRNKRRELESDSKQLRREIKLKEERCLGLEREVQTLKAYKDNRSEVEVLMTAISVLQDKNTHLENSLSEENRMKLDLFAALGKANRQVEIRDSKIRAQEREMDELKGKMAQVLAVMPSDSFGPAPSSSSISKLRLGESSQSNLDPNASVYTPKTNTHLTSEA